MPLSFNKRKGFRILFLAIAGISVISFIYLNLCADSSSTFSQYIGEINYKGFNVENVVLPDLHFFENGLQKVMDLILTRV